jgi:ABC-type nitrate/sulfonate/bicarbonate transport system substrate-binding protein
MFLSQVWPQVGGESRLGVHLNTGAPMQTTQLLVLAILALTLGTCAAKPVKVIRIGINPWPGFEFLYLAEQKGFFKEESLNTMVRLGVIEPARQPIVYIQRKD